MPNVFLATKASVEAIHKFETFCFVFKAAFLEKAMAAIDKKSYIAS